MRSQVASEVKRAAAESIASANVDQAESPTAVTAVAVVCETKRLFDAVADNLNFQRHVEGDGFVIAKGAIARQAVVAARPLHDAPDYPRLVTAIVDGHRPRFLLSVSEGVSHAAEVKPGTIVVANRLRTRDGKWLHLEGAGPRGEGFATGAVATSAESSALDLPADVLACDTWTEPIARGCQQAGVALMAVAVVLQAAPGVRSADAAALGRQATLAGRAGVLAGMLWKKRSGLKDVWHEKEAAWEASTRLAKLVQCVARAEGE